jgi:hypothetical protein
VRVRAHALEVDLPVRWEARIFRIEGGEPTLHAANFALPAEDGDFGAGALEAMGPEGAFLALTEFEPALAASALFAHRGVPGRVAVGDLSPMALQRRRPGQAGLQRFCNERGRAFCLYVVVGSRPSRVHLVRSVNRVLGTLLVGPRPAP